MSGMCCGLNLIFWDFNSLIFVVICDYSFDIKECVLNFNDKKAYEGELKCVYSEGSIIVKQPGKWMSRCSSKSLTKVCQSLFSYYISMLISLEITGTTMLLAKRLSSKFT